MLVRPLHAAAAHVPGWTSGFRRQPSDLPPPPARLSLSKSAFRAAVRAGAEVVAAISAEAGGETHRAAAAAARKQTYRRKRTEYHQQQPVRHQHAPLSHAQPRAVRSRPCEVDVPDAEQGAGAARG